MQQLALEFGETKARRERARRLTIGERFERWIANHPEVYDLFRRFALEALQCGHKRYSADLICARLRWHYDIELGRESGFRMNDHFTSRLARRLIEEDARFGDFFETRILRSE